MGKGDPQRYHIWYHFAKEIPVETFNPAAARECAEGLRSGGWAVLSNNCVHQAYEVLTLYGAKLPHPEKPLTNLIPKVWFAKIEGRQFNI
jgi:hypothetical protein